MRHHSVTIRSLSAATLVPLCLGLGGCVELDPAPDEADPTVADHGHDEPPGTPRLVGTTFHPPDRHIYDLGHGMTFPGVLMRSEGDPPTGDPDIDGAYEALGHPEGPERIVNERLTVR